MAIQKEGGISWTDATWNPTTGCTKVSAGCTHCYAERIDKRFGRDFSKIELHLKRLEHPLHWKKPRRIFVDSMSDLFHKDVPDEFIGAVFGVAARCPQHTFQILTKRAERLSEWFKSEHARPSVCLSDAAITNPQLFKKPLDAREAEEIGKRGWPLPNVWLGVSVEDQKTADERIPLLLQTQAAVRFVSYEPALGPVDFNRPLLICAHWKTEDGRNKPPWHPEDQSKITWKPQGLIGVDQKKVDWIIAGGESGPGARPSHPDWFRSVRDQCQAAAVPYFHKQNGEWCAMDQLTDEEIASRKGPVKQVWMARDGSLSGGTGAGYIQMWRVGKKSAGRLLDGREWDEFPKAIYDHSQLNLTERL